MPDITPHVTQSSPPLRAQPAADPWLPAILVLLTFACAVGAVVGAWWRVAPRPPTPLERYFPHADGVTLSYSVSDRSAPQFFQSSSTELLEGNEAGSQLPARLLTRALALAAGGAPTDDDEAMIARAQAAEAHRLRVARITDTTYQTDGTITHTVGLYLVLAESVGLIASDDNMIDPPLPILDLRLDVGNEVTTTGLFGSWPYTSTLTLEAREAVTTPAGRLEDCLRTRLALEVGSYDALIVSWYCAGVGLARQDARSLGATEIQRYELIGASAPGLLVSVDPPPVLAPDRAARPRGPQGDGALPALPAGELAPLWHYRLPGSNVDLTAAPLPAGELLIVGAANGGLVAIDRASHEPRWHFQAGGAIVGAPVAEDGVLYFGANDRKLYALDLASGAFRWAFAARDAISASPAVAGDTVYISSEDRNVYAIATASGRERWRFTAGDALVTTPRVAGDTLFVGGDDGVLYALDVASGALRWAFSAEDAITASPLVRGGMVYVGSHDGMLYALNAASERAEGELRWSYDAEGPIEADLASDGTTIYLATSEGFLRAVDAASGAERWRAGDGLPFDGAPLVAGERVLIGRGVAILAFAAADGRALDPISLGSALTSHGVTASLAGADGELFAGRGSGVVQVIGGTAELPWASGPVWTAGALTARLQDRTDYLLTPPTLTGRGLVGVTGDGQVYSVDLADGSLRDHGRLDGEVGSLIPPAADDRTLYAIDRAGVLSAFDLGTQAVRWSAQLDGLTRSAPALSGERVLVATSGETGTTVVAFDTAGGEQLWRRSFAPSPTGAAYTLLHDGRYFVTAGTLEALDPAGGEVLWSSDASLVVVQVAAAGETVYSVATDGEQWLLAGWDAVTGEQRLLASVEAPSFPNLAGGIAAGEQGLALLMDDNTLLGLDPGSGAERWRHALDGAPRGGPVVYGGLVLVQTQRNHLRAYDLKDGRLRGDFALLDEIGFTDFSAVTPVVYDGRVYAAFYQGLAALQLAEAGPRREGR